MHQPIDNEDLDDLHINRDPSHSTDCGCLRCHCMNLIETEDANDERDRQLAKKLEDGTPTAKDLRRMLKIRWRE